MSNERLLTIEDLRVDYGGIHAVKGISIDVPKDRIITLIGSDRKSVV